MTTVRLDGLTKRFGRTAALDGVSLEAASGRVLAVVGPSGCGKSTLLRLVAGLESADGGRILFDDADVGTATPPERGVAMVFQSYALYPHMTVFDNMAFALRQARLSRTEIAARVEQAAATLRIEGLLKRKPAALSGGQRQRVAIGRAIVRQPRVFLFDEPLSNLDATLRADMRVEIAELQRRLGVTTIYVTHDQTEAMTIADRIAVMNAGQVVQDGTPMTLYRRPANRFVAAFIGAPRMNFLDAHMVGGAVAVGGVRLAVPAVAEPPQEGHAVTLGVRPERVCLGEGPLHGRVVALEPLGAQTMVHVTLENAPGRLVAAVAGSPELAIDDAVRFAIDGAHCHLFDPNGRAYRRSV